MTACATRNTRTPGPSHTTRPAQRATVIAHALRTSFRHVHGLCPRRRNRFHSMPTAWRRLPQTTRGQNRQKPSPRRAPPRAPRGAPPAGGGRGGSAEEGPEGGGGGGGLRRPPPPPPRLGAGPAARWVAG